MVYLIAKPLSSSQPPLKVFGPHNCPWDKGIGYLHVRLENFMIMQAQGLVSLGKQMRNFQSTG
jgi:hypothetical protein